MIEAIDFSGVPVIQSETLVDILLKDKKINRYLTSLKGESPETYYHSISVARLTEKVARKLKVKNIEDVVTGALLHDVGKIFVPGSILNKPSSLTEGEFDNIRLHPINGLFYIMSDFNDEVNRIVRDHHEKLDGTGYFYGITNLTFGTQIVTVCDMYDAMTKREIYKEKYSPAVSLALLWKDADRNKVNPIVVDALAKIVAKEIREKKENDTNVEKLPN